MDSKQFKEAATSAIDESLCPLGCIYMVEADRRQLSATTIQLKTEESCQMSSRDISRSSSQKDPHKMESHGQISKRILRAR